jgi:hypothetical protein
MAQQQIAAGLGPPQTVQPGQRVGSGQAERRAIGPQGQTASGEEAHGPLPLGVLAEFQHPGRARGVLIGHEQTLARRIGRARHKAHPPPARHPAMGLGQKVHQALAAVEVLGHIHAPGQTRGQLSGSEVCEQNRHKRLGRPLPGEQGLEPMRSRSRVRHAGWRRNARTA